jgi:hypothetical protein
MAGTVAFEQVRSLVLGIGAGQCSRTGEGGDVGRV